MSYLLDTDTCIHILRNHPQVVENLKQLPPSRIFVSAISEYELRTGAAKSKNPDKEQNRVNHFLKPLEILPFQSQTTQIAADIRFRLEEKGLKIGPYDILIAASAIEHGLTLVSSNTREFSRIEGLKIENWAAR